ncbi:hypothetical protein Tco_0728459, partial [Tanacetum coccineum]
DVHQVGDEREVEVLRSFNWPPSELITEDGLYQREIIPSLMIKVRAVALLKGRWFKVYRDYLRRRAVKFNDSSGRADYGVQIEWDRWSSDSRTGIVGGEAYCSTGFEGRIVGCKPNPTSELYTVQRVFNSPYFMVKSWLVQDQTVLGKDYSNLLIADSLLKTIWFINTPCYGNEALASPKANELTIPEQTATGKGTSNVYGCVAEKTKLLIKMESV